MTSPATSDFVSFRELTWKTKWLLIAAIFLALWYCVRFLDRTWLAERSTILLFLLGGLIPQVFMLLFPLLTREKDGKSLHVPRINRWLKELAIAVPILMCVVLLVSVANYLVTQLFPGRTIVPDAIDRMARAREPHWVYPFLVFSFTFAPLAEEVFFRGFLFNALRERIPTRFAAVIQSLVFGFIHFFGTAHAIYATLMGLLLTLVYEWRKTLISPLLVHMGANLLSAIAIATMMAAYANGPMLGILGETSGDGCIVREVVPDSAAFDAGILVGDQIQAIDGQQIRSFPELVEVVGTKQAGDAVLLTFTRDGETIDLNVTLRRRGP